MKEKDLNVVMGVISDPIKNVYKICNRKDEEEIRRILRIFQMYKNQKIRHRMFAIKSLATFKLVLSNN